MREAGLAEREPDCSAAEVLVNLSILPSQEIKYSSLIKFTMAIAETGVLGVFFLNIEALQD